MPGKIGLRKPCSSVTFVLPPASSSRQVAGAGAVHRVVATFSPADFSRSRSTRRASCARYGAARVEHLDHARALRLLDVHASATCAPDELRQRRFDLRDDLRRRAAAVLGLVLEAVPAPRVVARRDDDAAARLAVDDREADDGRRAEHAAERHLDAVRRDDLRDRLRRSPRTRSARRSRRSGRGPRARASSGTSPRSPRRRARCRTCSPRR